MAINQGIITSTLIANRASGGFPMAGINFDRLALGIGMGIQAWGIGNPVNLALTGVTSGTAGSGIINPVTTRLIIPPVVSVISAALAAAGMVGPLAPSLAVVVALSISQSFSIAGQYAGPSMGVGLGADVSKVSIANSATLVASLMASLMVTLGPGSALAIMANGLGNGIASLLLLGTGIGSVNGPFSAVPAAGVSQTVVV